MRANEKSKMVDDDLNRKLNSRIRHEDTVLRRLRLLEIQRECVARGLEDESRQIQVFALQRRRCDR